MSQDPSLDVEDELDRNYNPPPPKSLEELLETDKEDESLRRYKEALLGGAATTGEVIIVGMFNRLCYIVYMYVYSMLC